MKEFLRFKAKNKRTNLESIKKENFSIFNIKKNFTAKFVTQFIQKMNDLGVKYEDDIEAKIEYQDGIKIEDFDDPSLQTPRKTTKSRKPRKARQSGTKSLPGVKNVVKNYGKAMCSFAYSDLARPYLEPIVKEEKVTVDGFSEWIQDNKERVDSIDSLRWLLLPTPKEDEDTVKYKRVFQKISEIFLKFFSLNWIYSGRLTHKETHLSFRRKMLRRVKNPVLFTYLRNTQTKK